MSDARTGPEAGFTLVEVLIALAILGISLPVLLGIFSDTLRRTRDNEARMAAVSLAQSLLAKSGIEAPLTLGDEAGDFGNGYLWQLHVEPYEPASGEYAWSVNAYVVTATVSWGQGATQRSLHLATLRLAPKGSIQ